MIRRIVYFILLLVLVNPAVADPVNDTAAALDAAVIPPRDRIDLARRLLDVSEIAPPPAEPPAWALGDVQSFWVTNEFENRTFQVEADLRTIGEHIYFWVERSVNISPAVLQELADMFDRDIYEPLRDLLGSEARPGIDGDPRVYGLFAYGQGPGVAAYFSSDNIYPAEAVSTSNEHEMFFFNLDTLGTGFDAAVIAGIVAHEFQHMIQEQQDTNESIWLNEGFSKFAEVYIDYPFSTGSAALAFLGQPETQLNAWPEDGSTIPHYGAGMLFVSYFYDRFGPEALRTLAQHPASGMNSVDAVLAELGDLDSDTFFADWVLTNYLQDASLAAGQYGYRSLPPLSGPATTAIVSDFPFTINENANQYSTDYFVFNRVADQSALDIQIEVPETIRLVGTNAASGQRLWYSNKADNSDTTLTRRFDLTGVEQATLNFKLWYHIEHLWDYGYVMVSTDAGATWDILDSPLKTRENPHYTAYGPGYTGFSEGWQAESLSLDAYVGQEILLRFEMITDDATTQPGMLIDDVAIPEIDYFSDFEADDGAWEARGWIWTDNTLIQQAWVQAVQRTGNDVTVTRWLVPTENNWSLPLEPGTDQVMVSVSPFAPLTLEPMPYTLTVDLD